MVFPQDLLEKGLDANNFAMLGLGDIVIPGIFIALLLRFDNRYSYLLKILFSPSNLNLKNIIQQFKKKKQLLFQCNFLCILHGLGGYNSSDASLPPCSAGTSLPGPCLFGNTFIFGIG